jgi:hypothetical protein
MVVAARPQRYGGWDVLERPVLPAVFNAFPQPIHKRQVIRLATLEGRVNHVTVATMTASGCIRIIAVASHFSGFG